MFLPIATILRLIQFCSKRRWPLLAESCSYFLLLNTIINPYYHSCVFMTDIYLAISLFYTQRGWHTSELHSFMISNFRWIVNVVVFLLGYFSGAWLCADVSEHSACSMTQPVKMEQGVPKRRHIQFRLRFISQNKENNTQFWHCAIETRILFLLCFVDRASMYNLFQMRPSRCTLLLSIFISTSLHVSGIYVSIIRGTYCNYVTLVISTLYGWLSATGIFYSVWVADSHPYRLKYTSVA